MTHRYGVKSGGLQTKARALGWADRRGVHADAQLQARDAPPQPVALRRAARAPHLVRSVELREPHAHGAGTVQQALAQLVRQGLPPQKLEC